MISFVMAALLLPAHVDAAPLKKTRYEMCVEQCLAWMDTPSYERNQCFVRCSLAESGKSQFMKQTKESAGECETYEDCDQDQRGSTDMDGNENEPQEPGPDDSGTDY